jgi:hypothetical protein
MVLAHKVCLLGAMRQARQIHPTQVRALRMLPVGLNLNVGPSEKLCSKLKVAQHQDQDVRVATLGQFDQLHQRCSLK